jgi:hypothetical protein
MQSARILRHSKGRKAEHQIGHAGNDDRRPERTPQGEKREWQVSSAISHQKIAEFSIPRRTSVRRFHSSMSNALT